MTPGRGGKKKNPFNAAIAYFIFIFILSKNFSVSENTLSNSLNLAQVPWWDYFFFIFFYPNSRMGVEFYSRPFYLYYVLAKKKNVPCLSQLYTYIYSLRHRRLKWCIRIKRLRQTLGDYAELLGGGLNELRPEYHCGR